MRTRLAALLVPATVLLTGCPGVFGCGAWDSAGDTVMRTERGDALILCENGGYAVTRADGTFVEGRYERDGSAIGGDLGETGARQFQLTDAGDGTMTSPELGAGWAVATLDQFELDKAHIQCTDLEARPWWSTATGALALPVATGFTRPIAPFASIDACVAAQDAGEFPADASCTEELMLCTDGSARLANEWGQVAYAYYQARAGQIWLQAGYAFEGVYTSDGALTSVTPDTTRAWTRTPARLMSAGMACQ